MNKPWPRKRDVLDEGDHTPIKVVQLTLTTALAIIALVVMSGVVTMVAVIGLWSANNREHQAAELLKKQSACRSGVAVEVDKVSLDALLLSLDSDRTVLAFVIGATARDTDAVNASVAHAAVVVTQLDLLKGRTEKVKALRDQTDELCGGEEPVAVVPTVAPSEPEGNAPSDGATTTTITLPGPPTVPTTTVTVTEAA